MSARDEPGEVDAVVAIYRHALPQVHGYLLPRCGSVSVAEDLTAETFEAAVAANRRENPPVLTVAWLIGVARHKLVDHWRRVGREERGVAIAEVGCDGVDDPWQHHFDTEAAYAALAQLSAHHRAVLTLRYLDGLPVAEVAAVVDRSVHATETLLMRAKAALRRVYREEEGN
ncbi:MAG TPA: sigma-70 family RNA polymerase sigma factor [Acidimicrobiales bacterium]|nr:sigma-70 family RNA polymerase sigma factor [Acidimicrobiales bacterium]